MYNNYSKVTQTTNNTKTYILMKYIFYVDFMQYLLGPKTYNFILMNYFTIQIYNLFP